MDQLNPNVGVLKLFPGITESQIKHFFSTPELVAVVIETYGAGNAPSSDWFRSSLEYGISQGLVLVNITQCQAGSVRQGKYETSTSFSELGVVAGRDLTTEAAVTKLMYLFGTFTDKDEIKKKICEPICGELTL